MTRPLRIRRLPLVLKPDPARVLVRPFVPAGDSDGIPRVNKILSRILALDQPQVSEVLQEVYSDFGGRHRELSQILLTHFERVRHHLPADLTLTEEQRLLIGAFFTNEYALESAALFNPSIVPHPDQENLPDGAVRIILSLRATGEGHISSITFRSGILHPGGRLEIDTPSRFVTEPRPTPDVRYERGLFLRKLGELGLVNDFSREILDSLT